MSQNLRSSLIVTAVIVLVIAGYVAFAGKTTAPTVSPSPTASQTVHPTSHMSPTSTPTRIPTSGSGAYGTITTGPTCPVQRNPPDPACADRPYVGTVSACVANVGAPCVPIEFRTNTQGDYQVALPAGTYYFIADTGIHGGRSKDIVVSPDAYTRADIVFDTGIR